MPQRASVTVSPSSSRTSRSTPWVDGCCGPMLTTMRSSAIGSPPPSTSSQSPPVTVKTRPSVVSRAAAYESVVTVDPHGRTRLRRGSLVAPPLVGRRDLRTLVLHGYAAQGVVLALGVPLPV